MIYVRVLLSVLDFDNIFPHPYICIFTEHLFTKLLSIIDKLYRSTSMASLF